MKMKAAVLHSTHGKLSIEEVNILDEMISMRLSLEEINDGFDTLEQGGVARSLVVFDP